MGIFILLALIIFTIYTAFSFYKKVSAKDYKLTGKEAIKNLHLIVSVIILNYILFWGFSSGIYIESFNDKLENLWFETTGLSGISYLIPTILLLVLVGFCVLGFLNYFEKNKK